MRPSWIFLVSALCTEAYSTYTQQVLGSYELLQDSYKCENGVKPSLECTDDSVKPNCSCTCSNGIMFNQTLSGMPNYGSNSGSSASLEACRAYTEQCMQSKEQCDKDRKLQSQQVQQLQDDRDKERDANKKREDILQAQLDNIKQTHFIYQGCYTDEHPRILSGHEVQGHNGMTPQICAGICKNYKYYGVEYSTECYCGNEIKAGAKTAKADDCNRKCAGDHGLICGGEMKISVYSKSS